MIGLFGTISNDFITKIIIGRDLGDKMAGSELFRCLAEAKMQSINGVEYNLAGRTRRWGMLLRRFLLLRG